MDLIGFKSALGSKTIWGAIIGLTSVILKKEGYDIDLESQTQLIDLGIRLSGSVMDIVTVIGLILTIYGRLTAKKKIIKPGSGLTLVLLTVGLMSLTGCNTVGAHGTSNDCLRDIAATEIAITQGYQSTLRLTVASIVSKDTAKKAVLALDGANLATDNAKPLCQMHDPKASDYINQAGAFLLQFNALIGGK